MASRWRILKPRQDFLQSRSAATVIQTMVRKKINQTAFNAKLVESALEARLDIKLSELQQQVSDEASIRQASVLAPTVASVDEKLLEEIEM